MSIYIFLDMSVLMSNLVVCINHKRNNMKILTKVAAILMVASALLSCKKEPVNNIPNEPEKPDQPNVEVEIEYTEDIEFSIKVLSVDATTAEIEVEHTGTEDDTWYGFATTSTNIKVAIMDMVAELTDNDDEKVTGLFNGYSKTIKLEGLEPETKYNYIVFAITEDGDVYGTEEHESFKTTTNYRVNSAWTVEFTGRQFIGEQEFENTVTVTSKDKNPYFMTIVTKDRFESTEIKTLLTEELESLKEFIDQYDKYYDVVTTFKSWCFSGSAIDAFGLESGYDYIAMAIGASEDGELTGLYAYSEVFKPYEEEMTEAYASWIGDWVFTGANGVSFDINIRKDKSNKTFTMTGWEGEEASHCEVIIDWYGDSWMIWSQHILSGSDPTYGNFDIYFCPVNKENGKGYIGDYPMCIGTVTDNGSRMVGIYQEESFTFTHMQFLAEWPDGLYKVTHTTEFPTFPITVTPATKTMSVDCKASPVSRKIHKTPISVPHKTLTINTIR